MSYINIFGGSVVQPALVSYLSITLNSSITLNWPSQFQDTNNVVAGIMDVTETGDGFTITMPDATQTSVGQTVIFNNVGAHTFNVLNNSGGSIATIAAGNIFNIYLINNTTVNGTWRVIPFGVGGGGVITSVAATSATTPALTITGSPITSSGTFTFTLDTDLVALDSFGGGTGIAARTGAGTWALRTITGGSNVSITNGNGVSGNPVIAINSNLTLTSATIGNVNIAGNTVSSTTGNLSITPFTGGNLLLGSNVSPVALDSNNDFSGIASATATAFLTSGLQISGSQILSRLLNANVGLFTTGTGTLELGLNTSPILLDHNNNLTQINSIDVVLNVTAASFLTSNLQVTGSMITTIAANTAIGINPLGTGTLLLGANATPVTIDYLNNVSNINTLGVANVNISTSITASFYHSPISKGWVYFNGAAATIVKGLNVTSVSRTAAGHYVVTWTSPVADSNYVCEITADYNAASFVCNTGIRTTSTTEVYVSNLAGTLTDAFVSVNIFD